MPIFVRLSTFANKSFWFGELICRFAQNPSRRFSVPFGFPPLCYRRHRLSGRRQPVGG